MCTATGLQAGAAERLTSKQTSSPERLPCLRKCLLDVEITSGGSACLSPLLSCFEHAIRTMRNAMRGCWGVCFRAPRQSWSTFRMLTCTHAEMDDVWIDRIKVEGYNYGSSSSIYSTASGYTYAHWSCSGSRSNQNHANGASIDQYCAGANVVIRMNMRGSYFAGMSLTASFLNPTGDNMCGNFRVLATKCNGRF